MYPVKEDIIKADVNDPSKTTERTQQPANPELWHWQHRHQYDGLQHNRYERLHGLMRRWK